MENRIQIESVREMHLNLEANFASALLLYLYPVNLRLFAFPYLIAHINVTTTRKYYLLLTFEIKYFFFFVRYHLSNAAARLCRHCDWLDEKRNQAKICHDVNFVE